MRQDDAIFKLYPERVNCCVRDFASAVSASAPRLLFVLPVIIATTFQGSASAAHSKLVSLSITQFIDGHLQYWAAMQHEDVRVAQLAENADRDLVANIQRLLALRGFDPGPADGIPGPRTMQAILDFQRSVGLFADGLPSRHVYERLLAENDRSSASQDESAKPSGTKAANHDPSSIDAPTEEAAPALPVKPRRTGGSPDAATSPAEPAPHQSLVNSVWRFVDSTGGVFTLSFRANGAVKGVLYEEFWSWRQSGDVVVVTYDNGMGLTVTRSGRLTSPTFMPGTADSSRSDSWTWTATRVHGPDATEDAGQ